MTEQEKDLEVIAALKAVAYDQAPPAFWEVIEREVKAGQKLEDATDIYGEILVQVMAYALLPSPGQEVAKHGSHDQKSHGRKSGASESDAEAAARMGKEFEAKRAGGRIDAIDEIAQRPDFASFIVNNADALGLRNGYEEPYIDEVSILSDAVERIRRAERNNAEEWRDATPNERTAVHDTVEQFTSGKVMTATHSGAAVEILSGDRCKSQFETQESSGLFDPEMRAQQETFMFRVHPGLDPAARPTYGYLAAVDPTSYGPAQYGDIRFELSDAVASRTTATLGDSLGSTAVPVEAKPTRRATQREAYDAIGWAGSPTRTAADIEQTGYMEAQIMGGWSRSDVTKVYIPSFQRDGVVAQSAQEAGIAVEYY